MAESVGSTPAETPQAAPTPASKNDALVRQAELIISNVLRGGVLLSAAIIVIGAVMFYADRGGQTLTFPHTLSAVVQMLAQGNPLAIIMLGLLVLLATPVVRVAVSIVAFALEHDRLYVGITSLVLAILLVSILVLGAVFGQGQSETAPSPGLGFSAIVFGGSLIAGLIGSLVGLGGGVFVVPLLTLGLGVPIEVAIGASIVSVIATSSGAAAAYVRDRVTNLRVGMFLEIATSLGAVIGGFVAVFIHPGLLFIIFGVVLLISAAPLIVKIGEELPQGVRNDRYAERLALASSYEDARLGRRVDYQVTRVPAGFGMMYIAGMISGLLGIGSGTFKVLAMDTAMRLPMKVSTTTSNFMIGVTAAASAGIYFNRGAINPLIAAPVALGVLAGATLGAKTLARLSNATIRKIFVPILVLISVEMLIRGAANLLGH
ncbi:MAG TPA: TSUP family transporter [Ktedonobacterales bacterium]|nr:TSUP family transporter [Ktedonobacterales bacterium]